MCIRDRSIEAMAEKLGENPIVFQNILDKYAEGEPELLAYFFSEDAFAFTNPEREWMLYVLMVLLESTPMNEEHQYFFEKDILNKEEKNWELLQKAKGKNFRDRLDIFFEGYTQEDLLAFVEDSVSDFEDENLTKEGREPMFIMLKTIIDVLIDQ